MVAVHVRFPFAARRLRARREGLLGVADLEHGLRGGQDVGDHAVPAHHVGGVHIDDVARLEREAVGQQHGVGGAAIQVEELGHVAIPAHHVDPLGVGAVLRDVAGVGQGFGQGGALLGHDQRAGLLHFAQHKDLVEAAVLHIKDVAGLEQGVLLGGAGFVHGLDVDAVGGALAGEQHAAVVGLGAEAAGAVDALEHGHGDVGDFLQAGLVHLAHHVHALAAAGGHAHVQLHLLDVLGEGLGEDVAHLAGGLAGVAALTGPDNALSEFPLPLPPKNTLLAMADTAKRTAAPPATIMAFFLIVLACSSGSSSSV